MNNITEYTSDKLDTPDLYGSIINSALKLGIDMFEQKRNNIILDFYKNLLEGEVTEERIKYEQELIEANDEQFFILLNLSINDDEKSKSIYYSNVFKFIRNNQNINRALKNRIIKTTKKLSYDAILLMKKINDNRIHNNQSKRDECDFLSKIYKDYLYEFNELIAEILIFESSGSILFNDQYIFSLNEKMFNELIKAYFDAKTSLITKED